MRAALLKEIGHPLEIEDIPDPPSPVEVAATGICHGDLHIISGDWAGDIQLNLPLVLGHEIALRVDGKNYLLYNVLGCGKCRACKRGAPQFCTDVKIMGIHSPGGFAQRISLPPRELLVPIRGDPREEVPLADSGLVAYSAVKGVREGDRVAILGTGSSALFGIQLAKIMGAEVTVVGRNDLRLSVAHSLGADLVVKAKSNYIRDLAQESIGRKFDYVIDFVGSEETLTESLWLLERQGELRIVGEFGGLFEVHEQLMVLRGLTIRGILHGSYSDMLELVSLFETDKLKSFVNTYSLEEINEAIDNMWAEKYPGRFVIVPS